MTTPFDIDTITEEKYREMLRYEECLRLSDFIQSMFQSKDTDDSIITLVQKTVLIQYGYRYELEDLENYRDCINRFDRTTFPMYWIKNNIMDFPSFKVGEVCPESILWTENKIALEFPKDFIGDKPLCVVGSSDSWPPALRDIQELDSYASTDHDMDYLFVYIRQAHSEDWPIGVWSKKPQPTTLDQRIERGLAFKDEYKIEMPMVFDTMGDSFNNQMKAWPLRMYVIKTDHTVSYIEPDAPDGIEITTRLENLLFYKEFLDKPPR